MMVPPVAVQKGMIALGATTARLVRHATSGDINGDYNAVVGYAAIVVC